MSTLLISRLPAKPTVAPVTPTDVKRARAFGLTIPAANPRDSWPAWTDEDAWTITEPARALADPRPSFDYPPPFQVKAPLAWVETAPGFRMVVNLTPETYVGPAPAPAPPEPAHSILDEAHYLGWELGYQGENPGPPEGFSALRLAHFYLGLAAGQADLHRETREGHDAWTEALEAHFPDRFRDLPSPCLAESGCSTGFPS